MVTRFILFILRYPTAHWHGDHTIVLTLLVSVVGFRCLTFALLPLLPEGANMLAIGAWVGSNIGVLAWQWVGTWRATERHLDLPPDMLAAVGGYFTMLVAAVLAVLQTVDGISRLGPPLSSPPEVGAAATVVALPLSSDARSVLLSGDLSYGVNTALETVLAKHSGVDTVELDSAGGHIFAARAIARTIQKHKLDTKVRHRCFSACTLAFMAGRHRRLGQDGKLGFHQYDIPGEMRVKIIDVEVEQAKDRDYFASRGVSESFLKQVFHVRHQDLWVPDRATLRAGRVITDN